MTHSLRRGASPAARAAITGTLGLALAIAMTACSGGTPSLSQSAGHPASQAPGAAPTGGATTAAVGKVSPMSIRFANFYLKNGKPGPALDIYDTPQGEAATPLLSGVAYGTVSAYAHPHLQSTSVTGQGVTEFYALPAGENPVTDKADGAGIDGIEDDGSHPQITMLLLPDSGSSLGDGPISGLSSSERVEKGDDNGSKGPVAPPPPAGKGEILVDTSPISGLQTGSLGMYLSSDGSCTPPINGDPSMPGVPYIFNASSAAIQSAYAIFPVAPGTHQVSVVAWTTDVTPTCAQLTRKQGTMSISVTAGQQVELYVYGTSVTDLHLAAAPIQP
jgi:hypothetical protein